VRVAAVFALALLVLSYLLNRQNILGQVYEVTQAGALVPVSNATIFVGNERTGVSTEKYGWFNFSVWSAFPARHRLKLKLENEDAHYPTDWRGPWPLQSALLNSPIEFRYDASKGVDERFHIARGASLFGSVVYAFGGDSMAPASARGSPASYARSEVEVGVLVDELNITGLPGKFFKPKRAYFKAFINGRQIPDRDVLAPSPATLGAAISFFPVQSDRRTWIPLGEGPKRYTNLLCRFPLDVVSLLAAGKQLTLARDVVIQMLSESGDILGQFTIVRGRAFTIGQSMRIADPSKSSTSITVRPVVHSTVSYNLDWKPANARLPPGGSQLFVVRMNRTPPLSLEATLEQTSAGASAVGLPRALRFAPSASASQLQVRVTKQRGTLQISSRLPAALGGTQDDVDIVVK
jgi:hypothetical protein